MRIAPIAFMLMTLGAPLVCAAELYRWVDEKGVTNYSTQQPTEGKSVGKAATVPNTISVYTPDKDLLERVEAARHRAIEAEKNPPPVQRAPREQASASTPAIEPCRTAECQQQAANPTYVIPGPVVVAGSRRPPRQIPQIQLPRGATAGNVVGQDGYIPGNSASVNPTPARNLSTQTGSFNTTPRR